MVADICEELESVKNDCLSVLQAVEEAGLGSLVPKAQADLQMVEGILANIEKDYDRGVNLMKAAVFQRFVASGDDKAGYGDIRDDITYLRNRAKDSIKSLYPDIVQNL